MAKGTTHKATARLKSTWMNSIQSKSINPAGVFQCMKPAGTILETKWRNPTREASCWKRRAPADFHPARTRFQLGFPVRIRLGLWPAAGAGRQRTIPVAMATCRADELDLTTRKGATFRCRFEPIAIGGIQNEFIDIEMNAEHGINERWNTWQSWTGDGEYIKIRMCVEEAIRWNGSLFGWTVNAGFGLVTKMIGQTLCLTSTNEKSPSSNTPTRYLQNQPHQI